VLSKIQGRAAIMAELSNAPSLTADGFTTLRRRGVLLSLTLSFSVGTVASTIYVPSIPAIARALDTSIARVQFTFVSYLLAYAISMLVLGPLSDRLGRRRTVLYGLALSAVSSLACAASPSIDFLMAARVLQGIGACAGMVVGRAITRDIWGPAAAAQVIAGRGIAATLMQVGAPVVGGYLQMSFGWRANFAAVAILACLAIMLMIRFVPDHGAASTASAKGPRMLASYRTLIGTRRFLGYALAAAGAHAGSHIFAAGAPAVLIGSFGVSPAQYGYYAALPPLGFLVGSFVSNRLTGRLGLNALITIGATVLIPAGLVMVTLAVLHLTGPFIVVGPMIFVCCGSGLITPNAAAGSLGVGSRIIGAASGLASFFQIIGAAGCTAALSLGRSGSPLTLAIVIAFAGLLCVTAFGSLLQPERLAAKADTRVAG
jgi:DHA1 family bicyclomycin/chloramphenicol resistance-like MFS transporter